MLFKYVLSAILPFIFAAILGGSVLPLSKFVSKRTKIPLWFCGGVILTLLFISLGFLGVFVLDRLLFELGRLSTSLTGEGGGELGKMLGDTVDYIQNLTSNLPIIRDIRKAAGLDEMWDKIDEAAVNSITGAISEFGRKLGSRITSFIAALPSLFIAFAVTFIASYYFGTGNATECFLSLIPEKNRQKAADIKKRILGAVTSWARAYLLLIAISFCLLFIGLLILKVKYAFLLAALISIVDILPVLGTGTVLIPWGVISMVSGNVRFGIGILILYGVVTLVREIAEPKVIGKNLGIPPLLTLVSMYSGLYLFGFFGMLAFPALAMTVKAIFGKEEKETAVL